MRLVVAFIALTAVLQCGVAALSGPVNGQAGADLVAAINSRATTWRAAQSPVFDEQTFEMVRTFLSPEAPLAVEQAVAPLLGRLSPVRALPATSSNDSFDARTKWPKCIGGVEDQGKCAGGWAVATASAASDRQCIASGATSRKTLAGVDILFQAAGKGCGGGAAGDAHKYLVDQGVTDSACLPYGQWESPAGFIARCPFDQAPCMAPASTPPASTTCKDGRSYASTKNKARALETMSAADAIGQSLGTKGPVTATLQVFEDMLYYSSGVYTHTAGQAVGYHSVKLVGFGVDAGTSYWIAQSSWAERWGDKGYFRIKRGTNECGIETSAFGAIF